MRFNFALRGKNNLFQLSECVCQLTMRTLYRLYFRLNQVPCIRFGLQLYNFRKTDSSITPLEKKPDGAPSAAGESKVRTPNVGVKNYDHVYLIGLRLDRVNENGLLP